MLPDIEDLGPVEYGVVVFPGSRFKGDIAPALLELVEAGTIRILDLVFLERTEGGTVEALEVAELDDEARNAFASLQAAVMGMVSDEDLELVGDSLEPGSSALIIVWEDAWASKLARALRGADAQILELARIPREIVEAAVEIAQLEETSS